ncbi:MAG: response regulator [bacterium]|nr:response regulator [bacterium]
MSKTVLIVEDDNFLQGLEATKIKKSGYDVLIASDGGDALKIIEGGAPIDLIILDLMMPKFDGFEFLTKIQKVPMIPVIVFSNLYEEADIEKTKKLGVRDFMVKANFTLDDLASKIKSVIG